MRIPGNVALSLASTDTVIESPIIATRVSRAFALDMPPKMNNPAIATTRIAANGLMYEDVKRSICSTMEGFIYFQRKTRTFTVRVFL